MTQILPNHLLRLKLFEGLDFFIDEDGGRQHLASLSRQSLQGQVDAWVEQTSGLVVPPPGPLTLTTAMLELPAAVVAQALGRSSPSEPLKPVSVIAEIRTLVVAYVPAVMQGPKVGVA